MIWKTSLATGLLLLFLLPVQASGAELAGRGVRIVGDTLVLLDATKTQHKVRLAGTAQSADNPGGTRAKQALSDYVFDRGVTVEWSKLDRYKRIVGNPCSLAPARAVSHASISVKFQATVFGPNCTGRGR